MVLAGLAVLHKAVRVLITQRAVVLALVGLMGLLAELAVIQAAGLVVQEIQALEQMAVEDK
jgi:hypothetical protein